MRRPAVRAFFALLLPFVALPAAAAESVSRMSFFVTSVGVDGGSGNLGGLAGADRHCQKLAAAVGAGDRTWRAFLSAAPRETALGVDARDRIGPGPWFNARGALIAASLDDLFGGRERIDRHTALDENGREIPSRDHDILTGSDPHGRLAFVYGEPATCSNWTSGGDGHAMMGHHDRFLDRGDRFPRWRRSWTASHPSRGCDAPRINQTGSAGLFYCFASDPRQEAAPSRGVEPRQATFRRGLNLAHWLSANYLPAAPYAAEWMTEEDVAWIADHGFDHLRVRVAGDLWIDAEGNLIEQKIAPFESLLGWAKAHGLGVVLTMYSLPGFHSGILGGPPPPDRNSPFLDAETLADHAYVWWLVARRFAHEGRNLRFELLHRPQAPDAAAMRVYNEALLAAIRESNPTRLVYITSRGMDIDTLAEALESEPLAADWNLALAFEFSEPLVFTRQFDAERPLVRFPGTVPDLSAFTAEGDPLRSMNGAVLSVAVLQERLGRFAAASRGFRWGREVYVAEFGVFERADDESTITYLRTLRDVFEREGWSWALYDYQSGCAVRAEQGHPTRVWEALFGDRAPQTPAAAR